MMLTNPINFLNPVAYFVKAYIIGDIIHYHYPLQILVGIKIILRKCVSSVMHDQSLTIPGISQEYNLVQAI